VAHAAIAACEDVPVLLLERRDAGQIANQRGARHSRKTGGAREVGVVQFAQGVLN
jgi:hypothetical protein